MKRAQEGNSGGLLRHGGRLRREAWLGAKFLAGTIAVFVFLHILVTLLVPLELTELFFAETAKIFVGFFGVQGTIQQGEPVLIFLQGAGIETPISISYLCTGLLEMMLLAAAIAASFGIETRKRILGIFGAVLATIVFNILRITASILLIVFSGLQAAEFGHEVLFRVFLFVTIAGYYAAWFWWTAAGAKRQE